MPDERNNLFQQKLPPDALESHFSTEGHNVREVTKIKWRWFINITQNFGLSLGRRNTGKLPVKAQYYYLMSLTDRYCCFLLIFTARVMELLFKLQVSCHLYKHCGPYWRNVTAQKCKISCDCCSMSHNSLLVTDGFYSLALQWHLEDLWEGLCHFIHAANLWRWNQTTSHECVALNTSNWKAANQVKTAIKKRQNT